MNIFVGTLQVGADATQVERMVIRWLRHWFGMPESAGGLSWGAADREYGVELSRNFRALKLWVPLKTHDIEAFRQAMEWNLPLARVAKRDSQSS